MTDFIGDIHGHAGELRQLLEQLGYRETDGCYRHPVRRVVFLGDYIDRGPEIPATLQIVRTMVEGGAATALMGNHEYNAIVFNAPAAGGGYLRPHLIKNFRQHAETLLQFQNRQAEYEDYVNWFRTLPLFLETPDYRAVHASWHQPSVDQLRTVLKADNTLTDAAILAAADPDSPTLDAIEKILKGLELPLPEGRAFADKDGHERHHIRCKWWVDPRGKTYEDLSVLTGLDLSSLAYNEPAYAFYGRAQKPVFFGHYWLRGTPVLYRHNVCCLDWSVAKGGQLVAYRFDGEAALTDDKLVCVS